jgi:hypothetical protein
VQRCPGGDHSPGGRRPDLKTFVVTRHGVPVGELIQLRRRRFVSADAALAMFRDAPSIDLARLRSDLDSVASQDPSPRA